MATITFYAKDLKTGAISKHAAVNGLPYLMGDQKFVSEQEYLAFIQPPPQPDELTALREQVRVLTEALAWYEIEDHYDDYDEDDWTTIDKDGGQRARDALAKVRGE
jgi:hypothetical protein